MYKATTKWIVRLSEDEEEFLWKLVTSGKSPARVINRVRILLKANQAGGRRYFRDDEIVEALEVSLADNALNVALEQVSSFRTKLTLT